MVWCYFCLVCLLDAGWFDLVWFDDYCGVCGFALSCVVIGRRFVVVLLLLFLLGLGVC